jgi:hypothetical protein
MMDWISIKRKKPKLGEIALILCQGYDVSGKHYWSDYYIGVWIKNPYDKRQRVFGDALRVGLAMDRGESLRDVWVYRNVTHWMPMPEKIRTI